MKGQMIRTTLALLSLCTVSISMPFADASTPQAVYQTKDGAKSASAIVYQYHENSVYNINTTINALTDIQLHEGETITYIGGGDTVRWLIDVSNVGNTPHVYIKPLVPDVTTNLIINTNRYSYRLNVFSIDTFNPIVRWEYPQEILDAMKKEQARPVYASREEKEFLDTHTMNENGIIVKKNLNYGYTFKNKGVDENSLPTEIFDDGTRTYFKMPSRMKWDFPTLYLVNDKKKLELVNYRVIGSYLVADRVFPKARLTYSSKSYLEITPKGVNK